ncbi:restriction endonuclease subunit S [Streptococcus mitis]|nr:restriction endonuclease subunit S [Streptococcus mitis]MQQ13857.1 restriction endonuclease subunit S [Streptococcus mitis]MQQ46486.1 restriction endonuclease subunit S [Streptococcus mitis]MQQ58004.1 restriction endonuclease subunit S [Streptococcus mitis]MQQ60127.1 restriction endonuclease subunit S [Streptococcus mitis]
MKKQSNTPEIRFQNYEDKWDIEKLINIFATIRNAFVGTATPYYVENGNFYLESNNVKNGKINYNSQIFINDEFYEKQRDKWLKTNDIVMVQSGHVGHTAVIPEELNNTAAHALIVFTDYKKEVNPHFLNYQFQSNGKRKELDLISTGNTIKHILASEMKNFKMDFPTFEEQSAISTLFRTLDDLLSSYKDNLANYQSLKTTMLSKMFPKAGQTVPEIRMDGFEGEWEIVKLGDNCRIITGGTPRTAVKEFWNPKEIPWMSSGEINKKILNETEEMISYIGLENSSAKWVKKNSVLIALAGQGQTRGRVAINRIPLTTNQSIAAIETNDKIDFFFLYTDLSRRYDELRLISSGDGIRGGLNKMIISNLELNLPGLDEQQAIGAYFSNLDNLINSHQEKITQLETLKKKLLQDMFI